MSVQTRSMTIRISVQSSDDGCPDTPHDLRAFNAYAEEPPQDFEFQLPFKNRQRFLQWDEDSDDDSAFIPSASASEASSDLDYDPEHFCPSWVKCCEENQARAPLPASSRWTQNLSTWRGVFTRATWRAYIGEVCQCIEDEGADQSVLTTEEYAAALDFMHGRL